MGPKPSNSGIGLFREGIRLKPSTNLVCRGSLISLDFAPMHQKSKKGQFLVFPHTVHRHIRVTFLPITENNPRESIIDWDIG